MREHTHTHSHQYLSSVWGGRGWRMGGGRGGDGGTVEWNRARLVRAGSECTWY